MTTALAKYNPASSLDALFPSRTARQTERLWATEKHVADANAVGFISYFMGPGPNPMALAGASTSKAWMRVDPDVTENAGSIRVYQGSGDATNPDNWPILTPGRYFAYLRTAAGASDEESSHALLDARATIAATSIGATINFIETAGYATAGDGGGAIYRRLSPAPLSPERRHVQSADGAWWDLVVAGSILVEQLGAKGDGTTDDSVAFAQAIGMGSGVVLCTAGKTYRVKDLTLSSQDALRLNGAKLRAATGAKWIVRLTGFSPEFGDGLVEDFERFCCRETTLATTVTAGTSSFVVASASGFEVGQWVGLFQDNDLPFASIITNIAGTTITTASACTFAITSGQPVVASWGMVNIQNSERVLVDDLDFVNTSVGIFMDRGGVSQTCVRSTLRAIRMTDVYYAGICQGRDVAEVNKTDVRIRGGTVRSRSHQGNGITTTFATAAGAGLFLKTDASVTVNGSPVAVTAYPSRFSVTVGAAPVNGATVVVNNFYDAWFCIWLDQTGWSSIRGGDVWLQTEVLDGFFGVYQKEKELLSTIGLIIDTCQVGMYLLNCNNQYHTSPFIGFCSRTLNLLASQGIHLTGAISTNVIPTTYTVTGTVFGNIHLDSTSALRVDTHGWTSGSEGASRHIDGSGTVHLNVAEIRDNATNSVQYANTIRHLVQGTPAVGVGVGSRYEVETSPGVLRSGTLALVCTDVTPSAEKFEWQLFATGGADFRFTSDDVLKINNVPVLTVRQTGFATSAGTALKNASAINADTITATDANIRLIARWVKALHDAQATHGLIGT